MLAATLGRPQEEVEESLARLATAREVVPEMARGRLRCPCHEGWFDAASGRPLAGPPPRPLVRVSLEVRGGVVHAAGLETPA